MARKKHEPVDAAEARAIGALLRSLRRTAGFRAVHDAASTPGCPAAQQTIYAYERGGLVPSLSQFLGLVEFYALRNDDPSPELRNEAIAAIAAALTMPTYHVTEAMRLMGRLRPIPIRDGRS